MVQTVGGRRRPMRMRLGFAVLAILLLALGSSARATDWSVEIVDFQFSQPLLSIETGDSVTWTNTVITGHTVTSGTPCTPDGLFDSGTLGLNDTFGYRFNDPGDFPYFCIPHCAGGMTASVHVAGAPATLAQTWGKIRALYR
jgi:plastocyanin